MATYKVNCNVQYRQIPYNLTVMFIFDTITYTDSIDR